MYPYALSREERFPLQGKAFGLAKEIMDGRDGAGFIFHVETLSGQIYSGPPVDPYKIDNEGILSIEHGEGVVFIQARAIAAIRVEEC